MSILLASTAFSLYWGAYCGAKQYGLDVVILGVMSFSLILALLREGL